jgi:hypothetical protein
MPLLRRYLAVAALLFWMGGFTFYASVVVPVGQAVTSHLRQGFITRRVTVYLNLSGAVALVLLAVELFPARDPSRTRRRLRVGLWLVMGLTLVALVGLHRRLDALLVDRGMIVLDPEAFRPGHRLYLWVSTLQWAAALAYLALTLRAWQGEDRALRTEVQGHEVDKKSAEAAGNPR